MPDAIRLLYSLFETISHVGGKHFSPSEHPLGIVAKASFSHPANPQSPMRRTTSGLIPGKLHESPTWAKHFLVVISYQVQYFLARQIHL